jgi:hypothetical protein
MSIGGRNDVVYLAVIYLYTTFFYPIQVLPRDINMVKINDFAVESVRSPASIIVTCN